MCIFILIDDAKLRNYSEQAYYFHIFIGTASARSSDRPMV
ncbi:hypothetical protein HMPREF0663_11686 [Hoylesella oralis ATCC 33269]|uniref:Uncharacterized protein n=1 Tax=Hoylesella oralis ATCC 33269 TaxID=873533 RepID=E7RR85_9BACT|nr:hypothetical protein HMPREF0663_11686 [Hoylesella oralis ATCC 33269]